MSRTAVILQPSFLPWLGNIEQLCRSDVFIYYDNAQYTKNDWRNRNRIKGHSSPIWITVPVEYIFGMKISEVKISYSHDWRSRHTKTFAQYYGKSKYFKDVMNLITSAYEQKPARLIDLNVELIACIMNYLDIKKQIIFMSDLNIAGEQTEKLICACEAVNANHYYSGAAAKEYLDINKFCQKDIDVTFQDYRHPVYYQLHGPFTSHLSIVDLMFNEGLNSRRILSQIEK